MGKYKCKNCGRNLDASEMVVSSGENLFCCSEHAPLEENSCALEYLLANPDEAKKPRSYFFIKLSEYQNERIS